ncbi:DUF3006 domain-containing protein [Sporomusa malonica]|uniref:DUF3006 domain-containing protein n=1 Tax=Sporomusa malonica TaxID=112901 RepID=A0A1W2EVB4_9FIRM|nr:DUF3006 domain-containing protein [Sporomusa malonica]SMD13146.1 Protein of unknown function [Sporomusa malonica]
MRLKAVIDRFEGSKAVLLAGEQEIGVNWPSELLPEAKEGDILAIEITVDVEATQQARAEIDALFEQIIRQDGNNNN